MCKSIICDSVKHNQIPDIITGVLDVRELTSKCRHSQGGNSVFFGFRLNAGHVSKYTSGISLKKYRFVICGVD